MRREIQLSGHDILFPERISANPLPNSFDIVLSPHTFEASWLSSVFNPPKFLITNEREENIVEQHN